MTHGVTVMSLSASLQCKTTVTMDRVCHFTFNWKSVCIIYPKSH